MSPARKSPVLIQPPGAPPRPELGFRFVRFGGMPSRNHRLPAGVKRLGKKATEYAESLMLLSDAGVSQARIALVSLRDSVAKYEKDTTRGFLDAVMLSQAVPVDIRPRAPWVMDPAGLFTLQALLFVWHARIEPTAYPIIGSEVSELKPFGASSFWDWWSTVRQIINHTYEWPDEVPDLLELVTAPSCRADPKDIRNNLMGKFRRRLQGFAPKHI